MDFTFTEDQLLLRDGVHNFFKKEVTPEIIRKLWTTESGRSDELWLQLANFGLTSLNIPEKYGGMGLSDVDLILLIQECGYVALPEPLVNTILVGVPILLNSENLDLQSYWLPRISEGKARLAVSLKSNLLVEDAHVADLLIIEKNGFLYAVDSNNCKLEYNESIDLSRKLYSVEFDESNAQLIADKDRSKILIENAFNRGALGCAAQALGLTQRMIDICNRICFK